MMAKKGYVFPKNKYTLVPDGGDLSLNQEGKLIDNALLISSTIEVISLLRQEDRDLLPNEKKIIHEAKILLEVYNEAEKYLSSTEKHLIKPEGVEIITNLRSETNWEVGTRISEAIIFFDGIIAQNKNLIIGDNNIQNVLDLLRRLLQGIKIRITQRDNSKKTLFSF